MVAQTDYSCAEQRTRRQIVRTRIACGTFLRAMLYAQCGKVSFFRVIGTESKQDRSTDQ